jgi:hypothetical protein
MVSVVIELFADAWDNQYAGVSSETIHFSESEDSLRFSYDDEGDSLAESGAWIVLGKFDDTSNLLVRDNGLFEGADHPSLSNDTLEFHASMSREVFLKRNVQDEMLGFSPFLLFLFGAFRHLPYGLVCEAEFSSMCLHDVFA